MRFRRIVYVIAVLFLGPASTLATIFPAEAGFPALLLFEALMSVMTYPSGFVASLIGGGLVFSGIVTPIEAIVMTTPIFAALGYLQWFWLFPRLYGGERRALSDPAQRP